MNKTDISERIRVRAYYLSLRFQAASPLSCWLLAEQTEQQLAQSRSAAARRGAETRRANLLTKPAKGLPTAARRGAKAPSPAGIAAH